MRRSKNIVKFASYNIQYGFGLDGIYDLGRIAESLERADVIALQEVTRGYEKNDFADMPADLVAFFPDYFWVYGAPCDLHVADCEGSFPPRGTRFQFGNMILSKTPIHLSRNLTLPRSRSFEALNFQRGALEALVETPLGFVRFYSTHLDHRGPAERARQIRFLRKRILNHHLEGGALSGLAEVGLPEPPCPEGFVLMGDFNMLAGSPEYLELAGAPDHEFGQPLTANLAVDAAARLAVTLGAIDGRRRD